MEELLNKLPALDSNPLQEQLQRLKRSMEAELVQAVQAENATPE
jgi:hypothetical protein